MFVRSVNIYIEQSQMILEWIVLEFTSHWNTGILNKDIQHFSIILQLFNDFIGDFLDLIIICHVKFNYFNIFAINTAWLHPLELFLVPGWNYYVRSVLVKLVSKMLSYAWRCPRYPYIFPCVVRFA